MTMWFNKDMKYEIEKKEVKKIILDDIMIA